MDPIPLHVRWWQNNMETRAFVFPCQSVPVVCGDASMRELCFYVFPNRLDKLIFCLFS